MKVTLLEILVDHKIVWLHTRGGGGEGEKERERRERIASSSETVVQRKLRYETKKVQQRVIKECYLGMIALNGA